MAENIDSKYFNPGTGAFNYNVTGSAESASGGSGGSGMECLQPRSPPPGPFHYLISEQAKSLVVLQELQNEVGALLDFRDLVIETFPNLRSKMSPSTPSSSVRREWEPGVRVRRKLAGNGDSSRAKPQPSVQDSGFSTETSCGKDNHSSAASTGRSRPIEDELWALLDVIQRKGVRLREEAESLRGELDERNTRETVEESFARILNTSQCEHRASHLEAPLGVKPGASPSTPLGRLDRVLDTPSRHPTIPTPDNKKFAAVLQESNPVELQRHLLTSIVQKQILSEKLRKTEERKSVLLEKLERAQDLNDDLKFQLEEKTIELEGARAIARQLESRSSKAESRARESRDSMRDLEPLTIPESRCSEEEVISATPRRSRPSRIPRARASRSSPARPASALSSASRHSSASRLPKSQRRSPPAPTETKTVRHEHAKLGQKDSGTLNFVTSHLESSTGELISEYLARTDRLLQHRLFSRLGQCTTRPFPSELHQVAYESPQNLASELSKSLLYENIDAKALKSMNSHTDSKPYGEESLWDGKPQQYFASMKYSEEHESNLDNIYE